MHAIAEIKQRIRQSPFGDPVVRLRQYVVNAFHEIIGARPKIPIRKSRLKLVRLGSNYGGWTIAECDNLYRSTILSCGAGEDISFDLLFADRYNARVIIVDPTPKAIAHVTRLICNLEAIEKSSNRREIDYLGLRLENLTRDQIILVEKALWSAVGTLRLFAPPNSEHVSHSALDFQNNYKMEGDFIEVQSTTLPRLLEGFEMLYCRLLKLDIEGAEVEVLQNLSAADILPDQICVEFDELNKPNRKAAERVRRTHEHLERLGYAAVYQDGAGVNFLYVKRENL